MSKTIGKVIIATVSLIGVVVTGESIRRKRLNSITSGNKMKLKKNRKTKKE